MARVTSYDETIEFMNEEYPFMVTHVLHMGRPSVDDEFPLARVVWREDSSSMAINVENFEPLEDEARTFVMMKETMHTLLNHRKLKFDDLKRAEMAADIVVNDYLVNLGLVRFEGLLYGQEVIGFDSYGLTVNEVYQLLPDSDDEENQPEEGGNPLADMLKEQREQKGQQAEDEENGQGQGQGQGPPVDQEALDNAPQEIKDAGEAQSELGGKLAGDGAVNLQEWAEKEKVELAWAELLAPLVPSAFKGKEHGKRRMTFNNLNRKVAWAAPKIILPVYRDTPNPGPDEGKKPVLVLAIDTSGSISQQTRDRFFRIAKSIPVDKVELRCLSFTSRVVEFEIDNPRFENGGTAFRPIEDWILANYPGDGYPDAVFMFTDGEASFGGSYWDNSTQGDRMPEKFDRWHWFLCDGGALKEKYASRSATVAKLERFVK